MGNGGWAGVGRPDAGTGGAEIRRTDADGLATSIIRLDAGLESDPLFAGLPEVVTDAEFVEITRSEDYDALMAHCKRVMAG
jgi:hypothetical protein